MSCHGSTPIPFFRRLCSEKSIAIEIIHECTFKFLSLMAAHYGAEVVLTSAVTPTTDLRDLR